MTAGNAASTLVAPPPRPEAVPVPRGPPLADRGTVRHDEVRARRWVLHGIAKVLGAVDVGAAELDGTVVVGGPLLADSLTVRGALEVRGTMVVAGRLRCHASLEAGASVRAGEASLEGPARFAGELVVDGPLRVRGALWAPNVRCARLELRGTTRVPGTVAATLCHAELDGDATLGTVQARRVRLSGPAPNVVGRFLGREAVVTVERVEAEAARLERVRVGFVRAGEIVLGPGAHVGGVEGRLARVHPSSRVGPESWSRPPAGLVR